MNMNTIGGPRLVVRDKFRRDVIGDSRPLNKQELVKQRFHVLWTVKRYTLKAYKESYQKLSDMRSVRKVPDLFLFCENPVDFNYAHLYEATLNFHTHA